MWFNASHLDSREIVVTFEHYAGKVAFSKFDEIVTYWKANRRAGLRRIIQRALGKHMVDTLDIVARNAYIAGAIRSGYNTFAGSASSFATVGVTDLFDPGMVEDVWLRLFTAGVVDAAGESGAPNILYCITTPGVVFDIRAKLRAAGRDAAWIPIPPEQFVSSYEVGQYGNVRFIMSNRALLANSGTVIWQAAVVNPINAGDGAPDPNSATVDGTYRVGQPGAVHYIQLAATDLTGSLATDVQVNDLVTVHVSRLSAADTAYGVQDGVDFRDGKNHHRRVVSIDTTNRRIVLDRPIMIDMKNDLGGGVYAWVTKARHIHSSTFVHPSNLGIIGAVSQPPMTHEPPVIDDAMAMYRFTWDGLFGANLAAPENFETVLSAGSFRLKGSRVVQ